MTWCICMVSNNQILVQIPEKTPTMSIDKHKSSSYNEHTICKSHTLPKCTIMTEGSMIFAEIRKRSKIDAFSQK